MKKAIKDYSSDFIAMIVLALVAVLVGGFILSNQRFYLPAWVPFVGTDFYALKAEMQTAQAITPGQGQTVAIAGVPVGEITAVNLVNGRAVVSMDIERKYADEIHQNATILTRPKTGLNDMLLELNPGTKASGRAPDGYTIPVSHTLPNVNPDEFLAALDTGTRNYLKLLIGGAGEGLQGNRKQLAATFKRFDPIARDVDKITRLLAQRHVYVARNITNLKKISTALAGNDKNLSAFIDSSNKVFASYAAQDQSLSQALAELPTALNATNNAVQRVDVLGQKLGPTFEHLRPFAQNLAPAQIASQDFFRQTTDVLKNQVRPFAVAAQPTVANLRPASADLASATPKLATSLNVLNYLFNLLAYNPKGNAEGYLFYLAWANHIGPLLFSNSDALGPLRRGVLLANCPNATALATIATGHNPIGVIATLVNVPTVPEYTEQQCIGGAGRRSVSRKAVKAANPDAGASKAEIAQSLSLTPPKTSATPAPAARRQPAATGASAGSGETANVPPGVTPTTTALTDAPPVGGR